MNNLSIAFLSRDLPSEHPNGVSCQVDILAEELVKKGHKVTIFSLDKKPDDASYDVITKNNTSSNKIKRLFEPAIFFRKQNFDKYDIIHAHGDNYLIKTTKPVIRTFYGSALLEAIHDKRILYRLRQGIFYLLEWASAMRSDINVGISKSTKTAIPIIDKIIPCAVDTNFFQPKNKKTNEPSILFVGNMSGRKRGWELLNIFTKQIKPALPSSKLMLVTSEKVESKAGVEVYNKPSRIKMLELYQQAWIVCVTSSYEGFGVPAIEALASGTPVVSTYNSGSKEVITHGKDGILCRLSKVGMHIKRLLKDKKLRMALEKEGIKKAKEFSIKNISNHYENLYRQLLS